MLKNALKLFAFSLFYLHPLYLSYFKISNFTFVSALSACFSINLKFLSLLYFLLSVLLGLVTALLEVILASKDCLVAGDSCSSDETCSPRLRTLRQCVAGNGSMKLGPGARSQCANAVSALLSSPLHGCQCKRGMKKEKNCLSIYWSLHQSIIHGQLLKTLWNVVRTQL